MIFFSKCQKFIHYDSTHWQFAGVDVNIPVGAGLPVKIGSASAQVELVRAAAMCMEVMDMSQFTLCQAVEQVPIWKTDERMKLINRMVKGAEEMRRLASNLALIASKPEPAKPEEADVQSKETQSALVDMIISASKSAPELEGKLKEVFAGPSLAQTRGESPAAGVDLFEKEDPKEILLFNTAESVKEATDANPFLKDALTEVVNT